MKKNMLMRFMITMIKMMMMMMKYQNPITRMQK